MSISTEDDDPLVTRKAGVQYCREEDGLPITRSFVDKAAMRGEGPPVEGYWGKIHLHRRSKFVAWAKSHISEKPRQGTA